MKYVVLLRGINVGGNNKVPMAELKKALVKNKFQNVQTYIASGNIVLESALANLAVEENVAQLIEKNFKCSISVIARSQKQWNEVVKLNPFGFVDAEQAKQIHLGLTTEAIAKDSLKRLMERAIKGEVIHVLKECVYIDFNGGLADTKLTPSFMEKCLGSPVTLRNLNTVNQLSLMLEEPDS
jgi:uncharacterized protein (DUF1697 family)